MMKSITCICVLLWSTAICAHDPEQEAAAKEKDAKENAVAKAARRFRIDTYERYRLQREIYNTRRAMGNQMIESWEASAQTQDDLDQAVNWLDRVRILDQVAAFPPMPELPIQVKTVADDAAISEELESATGND
ncbi:MAG: hypothetical protein IH991_10305 [Planctomycetes bacterium]|nr:hypothetical protein [Planctomycetota bacterium]